MRDNWCVGYSKKYTVGVWVGNLDGSPMWDVSGVTGAAPIWNAVMNLLQERENQSDHTHIEAFGDSPPVYQSSSIPKILIPKTKQFTRWIRTFRKEDRSSIFLRRRLCPDFDGSWMEKRFRKPNKRTYFGNRSADFIFFPYKIGMEK